MRTIRTKLTASAVVAGTVVCASFGGLVLSATSAWASNPVLSVIAGSGSAGAPTAGPATSSHLSSPSAVAVDSAGNMYIADTNNNVIEKVSPSGSLSIFAGTGTAGLPTAGPATSSELSGPNGVAVDSSGNVYISDGNNLDVEKVTPGGTLSIFAGVPGARGNAQSGVAATSLHFYYPDAVAVDPTGDVYIADLANNVIDEVNTSGINTIVAGQNQRGGTPSAGPATSTNIAPTGLAVDGSGNFYISDARGKVLKVTAGTLSIYPGTSFSSPAGLAVDSTGDLYVADSGHNEVAMVNTSGAVSVAVGTGAAGAPIAGPPTASPLSGPSAVAVDSSGTLYIADTNNSDIDRVGMPLAVAPVFTADSPATSVTAGTPFSYTFTASGAPAPTFAVASGALPGGLSLNGATGVLSGTPTSSGTFTVSATNTATSVSTPTITISVTAPTPPTTTTTSPPTTTTPTPSPAPVSPQATTGGGGSAASTPDGDGYWLLSSDGSLSPTATLPTSAPRTGPT
jgi:sugar lactone lactonase YvrE